MSHKDRYPRTPPQLTLAQLAAAAALLTVTDAGARARCTDWAGGSRDVFWTGTTWQANNNYAPVIKRVTGIADDSLFTNAAPPSGAVTPYLGTVSNGNLVVLDAGIANNTKWGGIWEYNSTTLWTRAKGFEDGAQIANPTLFMVDGDTTTIYGLQRGSVQTSHQAPLGISAWTVDVFLTLGGGGGSGLTHQEVMARLALGNLI